jgi:glucokinase
VGGIVYEGDLLQGESGQAGYVGHIKITFDETAICSCGKMGCVETLASGPAIVRRFNAASGYREGDGAIGLSSVCEFARRGNVTACSAFAEAGYFLGVGVGNAMDVLNPSVVTVGGGVILASESIEASGDGGPYFRAVAEGIQAAAHKRAAATANVRQSIYGNDGGMIGVALIAPR